MLFHTTTFLIFFLVFISFYFSTRNNSAKIYIILVFSNIFYGWWNWKFLGLIWLTILLDFMVAKRISKTSSPLYRKLLLSISIVGNLSILGFFKYYNFFLSSIEFAGFSVPSVWVVESIILPVGLSFYIFQSMSYTFDVYRKRTKSVESLVQYAAFVSYFPQLVAGPIERLEHLLPQICLPSQITRERISAGILLFSLGFFRKALADNLGFFINPVFDDIGAASSSAVVFAILGFGLQIYLDFSGYSDMARGISKIMGIDLMINFKTPYFSFSPREFWRRWHISLSQWLRDYLYISLGGSRRGFGRHIVSLNVTMILGGLWHGAGFNFLIWGALHGLYLSINTILSRLSLGAFNRSLYLKVPLMFMSWVITWIAVNYAWLYFRIQTFEDAMIANHKIIEWVVNPIMPDVYIGFLILLFIMFFIDLVIRLGEYQTIISLKLIPFVIQDTFAAILICISLIITAGVPTEQFIYFQF